MKKFLKAVGCCMMALLAVKGIFWLADVLHRNYGKKYIVTDLGGEE
jgi:hypothetical protein